MQIFKAERDAGLESLLLPATASIKYDAPLSLTSDESKAMAALLTNKTVASHNDSDLFKISSLMVSVGWNKNEDVFLRDRVWAARNTPEDKPLNIQHNELDIVGHIIGNYVIDNNGSIIAEDTPVEELPDIYHIIASSVMYQHWSDEKRLKTVSELINQIKEDLKLEDKSLAKWFVSMECLFSNFDYAVIGPDGKQSIIARTEESAFLTSRLKAYGGDGKYGEYRVGRAMKNLAFSALGLVNRPANPPSVIFDGVLSFREEANSQVNELMETVMANANDELLVEYKEKIAKLEADYKASVTKVEAIEKSNKELSDKVVTLEADNKTVAEKLAEVESEKTKLTETLADVNTKLEASTKSLEEIKASELKAKRVAVFVEKGMSKEDAEKNVDKFAGLNDESFDAVASLVNVTKVETPVVTPEVAASAAASVIESAKANEKPALNVNPQVNDDEVQKAKAAMVEQLATVFTNKSNVKK